MAGDLAEDTSVIESPRAETPPNLHAALVECGLGVLLGVVASGQ